MRWTSRLSLNQKLAAFALVLGVVAVFARVSPARTATVNAKELLTEVERQEDHVAPQQLAAWIVEGRADYRLVDLRDAKAFAEYHIPTAENVPLAQVADGALARNEKLVLYGQGVVHAAQAFMVLKGQRYRTVYTLQGGLDAWKGEILYPVRPQQATGDEEARFERATQLARFFGGQAREAATGSAGATTTIAPPAAPPMPTVAAPMLPTGAGGSATGPKKKKEGC